MCKSQRLEEIIQCLLRSVGWVHCFSLHCDKIHGRSKLREERLLFADSLRRGVAHPGRIQWQGGRSVT